MTTWSIYGNQSVLGTQYKFLFSFDLEVKQ